MPDPNQNKPQPTVSSNPTAPPVISPTADLPPLPPDFQSMGSSAPSSTEKPKDQPADKPSGSSAPPDLAPVVSSTPKKKFGGGRIIATILGVVFLVGGVFAGYATIRDPLIFQELAAGKKSWRDIGSPRAGRHAGKIAFEEAQRNAAAAEAAQTSRNTGGYTSFIPTGVNTSGPPPQGTYPVYQNGASSGTVIGYRYIDAPGVYAGAIDRAMHGSVVDSELLQFTYNMSPQDITDAQTNIDNGLTWVPPGVGGIPYWHWTACIDTGTNGIGCSTGGAETTNTQTEGTPVPTPTPGFPECLNVKAYSSTWTPLADADLSTLTPGTNVNFCVSGTLTTGTFDQADFKINSAVKPVTTTKRPGSGDFCQSYTILSTDTTIDVSAKIHNTISGWVGESF